MPTQITVEPADVLEEIVNALESTPHEMGQIFGELSELDIKIEEMKRDIRNRQSHLARTVKGENREYTIGADLVKHPGLQEPYIINAIQRTYQNAITLAKNKVNLTDRILAHMDIHIKKLTADMAKMDNNMLNEPISVKDYVDPPSAAAPILKNHRSNNSDVKALGTDSSLGRSRDRKKRKSFFQFNHPAISPGESSYRRRINEPMEGDSDELYCICRQVSYGEMVACDNEMCAIEWFHMPCVGLTSSPPGVWYCRDCRKDQVS